MLNYFAFIRRHFAMLGFGFIAVFWGNFGQSFFIAWFGADIQQSLGISASIYGSTYSFATLLSAFGVIWLGGLIDKVALRTYALTVAAGLCLACVLLSLADAIPLLFIGLFLLRLFGQSLLPHTGVTTMARHFDGSRGKAISVAMSGVPSGEIVLPIIAVAVLAAVGWQNTFLMIGITTALVLVPMFWWLSSDGMHASISKPAVLSPGAETPRSAGRKVVLSDYRYWLAMPGLLANPFLITGIFIHQNFIVASKDWTVSWLATCFVVYGIVHWLSSLLFGALVDRYKSVRLLPYFLLPLFFAMLVLAYIPGWWTAMLLMTLLGFSSGSGPPITNSLWAEIYSTRNLGAIRSMNMAIMVGTTAIAPVLFGYFIDQSISVAALFGPFALFVAIGIVSISCSYPLRPQRHPHASD
jgi:predicted MFS family arabinose efflux permease